MEDSRLDLIIQQIIAFRDARDWKQFHNPKDCSLSLILEAAEVAEHFQWKNQEEMQAHLDGHREEVADELADAMYWILLMSHDAGIDILEAVERKLGKNNLKYPVDKSKGRHTKYTEL
ncbi:MAG: nucleotide pyrophosphohydrolase [Patescibacteria group bacterium]